MSGAIVAVTIPKWGMEMAEGTISRWTREEGERVEKGEELVEIESDKVVNAMDSPGAGILRRRLANDGDTLAVGTLIAVLAEDSVDEAAIDRFIAEFRPADVAMGASGDVSPSPAAHAPPSAPQRAAVPSSATRPASGARVRTGPVVERLALQLGVDLAMVAGSGRDGRILQADVHTAAAMSSGGSLAAAASDPDGAFRAVRLSATRRTIARRMQESMQTIPHFYLSVDVQLDALLEARRRIRLAVDGSAPTVTELLVWAVARALRDVPAVNVQLAGEEIREFEHAGIAVAIATEGGLVAPVVRAADTLGIAELAGRIRSLAERARAGDLAREDLGGGTFTVSNLGMLGIDRFTSIITPPQCAALAVGRGTRRLAPGEGAPIAGTFATCTLSCDHRVIDGAVGARFLEALRRHVESAPDVDA